MSEVRIDPSADVDTSAAIGPGTSVWHLVQIRENARIGRNCVIGRSAYIGPGVRVGDNVKIQNLAQIYDPAVLGDGAFIGPGVILTNDVYPRAIAPDGRLKDGTAWDAVGVTVDTGASIGARAVVLGGVRIGAWALVGAGSVVIRDVAAHALAVGNPAHRIGWVGRHGVRLVEDGENWRCPATDERYVVAGNGLRLA